MHRDQNEYFFHNSLKGPYDLDHYTLQKECYFGSIEINYMQSVKADEKSGFYSSAEVKENLFTMNWDSEVVNNSWGRKTRFLVQLMVYTGAFINYGLGGRRLSCGNTLKKVTPPTGISQK